MGQNLIEDRRLTVMLTYRCNAQCKDCGTFSSPHDKNEITLETALASIDEAHDYGIKQVIFTGGEATLRWDDLLVCIKHAHDLGLLTRLVTNGRWAVSKEEATRCKDLLLKAGLNEINFSTGDEHVRFVPLEHVLNGIGAFVNARVSTALMFELRANSKLDEDKLKADLDDLASKELMDKYFVYIRSPWMPIKPTQVEEYPESIYANIRNVALKQGCDSCLSDYVVQGTGRIAACCGLGMRSVPEFHVGEASKEKGDTSSLANAIDEAESDLFLYALRKIGPEKILAWAAQKDPTIKWENMYAHRCQACMRIYRDPKVKQVIAEHMEELIADMIYGGYVLKKFEELAKEAGHQSDGQEFTNYV